MHRMGRVGGELRNIALAAGQPACQFSTSEFDGLFPAGVKRSPELRFRTMRKIAIFREKDLKN